MGEWSRGEFHLPEELETKGTVLDFQGTNRKDSSYGLSREEWMKGRKHSKISSKNGKRLNDNNKAEAMWLHVEKVDWYQGRKPAGASRVHCYTTKLGD